MRWFQGGCADKHGCGIMQAMEPEQENWMVQHFSQSNPEGPGQGDVPDLLRRVAGTIEEMGAVEVQDIVFHEKITDDGDDWPYLTVYFNREAAK